MGEGRLRGNASLGKNPFGWLSPCPQQAPWWMRWHMSCSMRTSTAWMLARHATPSCLSTASKCVKNHLWRIMLPAKRRYKNALQSHRPSTLRTATPGPHHAT
eukprot:scaffold284137_cov33-Tisochrysis_lutea.AAC.2